MATHLGALHEDTYQIEGKSLLWLSELILLKSYRISLRPKQFDMTFVPCIQTLGSIYRLCQMGRQKKYKASHWRRKSLRPD